MTETLTLISSALLAFAWTEFREWLPWLAKRLIILAVNALPLEDQPRMQEELIAEVESIPGKISPFIFAFSLCCGFWRPIFAQKLDKLLSRYIIRSTDIFLGLLTLLLLSPLIIYCTIKIKKSIAGPAFIYKDQLGQNDIKFRRITFRTVDNHTQKLSDFGKFLIKTSLEGLPSILNVLKGEMSLVGPPSRKLFENSTQFSELRPGFVWFLPEAFNEANNFGQSTKITIKNYFILIRTNLIYLLTADERLP